MNDGAGNGGVHHQAGQNTELCRARRRGFKPCRSEQQEHGADADENHIGEAVEKQARIVWIGSTKRDASKATSQNDDCALDRPKLLVEAGTRGAIGILKLGHAFFAV